MRRLSIVEFSSFTTLLCAGLFVGCGDNVPKQDLMDGGSGGSNSDGAADRTDAGGGTGGSAGGGIAGNGGSGGRGGSAGSAGSGGLGGNAGNGGGGAGGVATTCPMVAFTSPLNSAVLTAADDASGMSCATGFKYNVKLSVTAADGTAVELHGSVVPGNVASPPLLATALVSGSAVTFPNVQLSEGSTTLTVEIAGVKCSPAVTVTVSCKLPTCSISLPTHDLLNGVAAPAGDRASSAGSDFQAAFAVTTDIEDGQPVVLTVTSVATPAVAPVTVTATAASGKASFAGVTLKPDGQYGVTATCTNKAAAVGHSMSVTYTVDTTAPTLTVDQPANGSVIGPTGLTNGAFKVCGTTTSADAVNLPVSAGAAASNLCVTRGQTTTCVPVTAVATSTCVNVACPGGAPFDLSVKLFDAAGNPTTNTVTGISCASTLPSVEIVAPLTDSPNFTDATKRLLSSTATQTLKDADGATAGAQTTVVACTDTAGGLAKLFVGHKGDATLTALGSTVTVVAAVTADNCSAGKGFVAKFVGVTLPESTEAVDGSLTAATEIRVDVADATNAAAVGTSGPTDLWVDSTNPTLSEKTPTPLCGSTQVAPAGLTTFTTDVSLNSSTPVVTLQVTNGLGMAYGPPTYTGTVPAGSVTFTAVAFPQGDNLVDTLATEPAGNTASLTPPIPMPTCKVTVGSAPAVTFTSPAPRTNLCANGNTAATCIADSTPGAGASAGWQGNVTVHVTSGAAPLTTGNVTFTIAGGAPQTVALNATGDATLAGVTIADGPAVLLTATTDNVPGHGVGTASETVVVDSQVPLTPATMVAAVNNRRQTSFTLTWTAPADADGVTPVVAYDVRYSTAPITDATTFLAATAVPFGGAPKTPGGTETLTISNLYIETSYNFAVVATDAVGNRSLFPTSTAKASFTRTVFPSASGTNEELGYTLSADGDLNGDGLSDILAGTFQGGKAYLFFGSSTFATGAASVVFSGATAGFGSGVAQIGDVNNDGLPDLAIADPNTTLTVYIYKGRINWPMTLTSAQADYTIVGGTGYTGSLIGKSMARLGDFTGDGVDDFAIGAAAFTVASVSAVGQVIIIPGKAIGFASVTLPDAVNAITITGDATLGKPALGYRVLGLGHYYSVTTGTTLVASAPGASSSATANMGHVYAFHGQAGTAGVIAAADHSLTGPISGARIGLALANLGPVLGPLPAVGVGNPVDTADATGGAAFVMTGSAATGPFVNKAILSLSGGNTLVGGLLAGGGLSGRDVSLSVIGDATPDVFVGGESGLTWAILDGAKLATRPSPVDAATVAEVKIQVPSTWQSGEGAVSLIPDINGDGVPDFCVGNAFGVIPGAVAVYW